jgi:4-aminobutyrate aminotransferase/(S)-3-amino-2-methylpropionate transaminase
MGLTGKDKPYKEGFGPFPDFVHHTEYPYEYRGISDELAIEKLDTYLSTTLNPNEVAAIVIEIQLGEGGYIPASKAFIQHLRKVCDENGILLIFDEVQTGFGRTGKMFGADHVDVEPDIVTLAKGIAGGFPLAAVLGRSHIMDSIHDAGIGSTFGASPISCAASLGVLEAFDNENIISNTKIQEKIMKNALNAMMDNYDFIGDVRGYGPMIGVEIVESKISKIPDKSKVTKILDQCKENGLLLVSCGQEGNVIRFMGPLTTPQNQVEEAMEIFKNSLV